MCLFGISCLLRLTSCFGYQGHHSHHLISERHQLSLPPWDEMKPGLLETVIAHLQHLGPIWLHPWGSELSSICPKGLGNTLWRYESSCPVGWLLTNEREKRRANKAFTFLFQMAWSEIQWFHMVSSVTNHLVFTSLVPNHFTFSFTLVSLGLYSSVKC